MLFCDVVGSTSLGESTDPEALRALLARYFERMRGIVEGHGGSVEKFIGDAVMAVFGVPSVHEDDALRACRAAVEMREAFAALGVEGRIGVSTGEVVTGTAERLATGDALNVAARLQQAAQPGEVLIAAATRVLAGGAVDVEPVEPLALKGKRVPVAAFRLLGARAAVERRHEMVFVGREHELALLGESWGRALAEQRCELVTVVGDAGMGKSRLAAEALESIAARVVRGRCLPYGAGITYWPVVEVVKQLGVLPSDPAAAAAIRSLLGETDQGTSAEEIAWAFRKLLEEQAPLVVLFDDIQWGEETFLDLIEHVALLSSGAPLLLVCPARPELLDSRPTWPVTVRLEPLSGTDSVRLIGARVAEELRAKIAAAAGGNPLFIGEMLAMAEVGGEEVEVPATLKALLAARLDQLDPGERRVLERGAVEGEVFHRGAVQALTPEEPQVTPRLASLVRRELIRSERAQFAGEDGFRFRHLLIRDAVYDALPKATRAELHERFAGWLEQRGADLVELDEIIGYHLEQAYRYKLELGQADDDTRSLAAAAAEQLRAAGWRAVDNSDIGAARTLLERTLALLPPEVLDVVLELKIAQTLFMAGDPREAVACAVRTAERAAAAGNRLGELHARIQHVRLLAHTDPEGRTAELEALVEEARPLFEHAGYDAGLAALWNAVRQVEHIGCRFDAGAAAVEHAIEHARHSGDRQLEQLLLPELVAATLMGTKPVGECLLWLDDVVSRYGDEPLLDGWRSSALGLLGRFQEARAMHAKAVTAVQERGARIGEALLAESGWRIELDAHDFQAAERIARRGCELLQEIDERGWLSTQACHLAESLYTLGRDEEAAEWAELGLELGASNDVLTQMLARQVLAKLAARRGEHAHAETLAGAAVALAETIQFPVAQADAHMDLAEVLATGGQPERATTELERAAALYERKGATPCLTRSQQRLRELAAESSPL